jgi:hypothetical protein
MTLKEHWRRLLHRRYATNGIVQWIPAAVQRLASTTRVRGDLVLSPRAAMPLLASLLPTRV